MWFNLENIGMQKILSDEQNIYQLVPWNSTFMIIVINYTEKLGEWLDCEQSLNSIPQNQSRKHKNQVVKQSVSQ